jgi:hypothetical protein
MSGYPYADSIKQYKTRNMQSTLGDVQDADDTNTLASETRDDIGVFASSLPNQGIPPIWLTAEHSSTRASSPIQAYASQAYTFSNGTTPSFSQVLDPASASSDIHQRSHNHWSSYSSYDTGHPDASYDSNELDHNGLRPVRPELKSTFSTPSQSPSSPRLSRPLGLGGFFLSGSSGSGGGGGGGRELTFTPPAGPSNPPRATSPDANAGTARGASPEGISSKRHSTYAKLKTLTKRYSLSINPFSHGASGHNPKVQSQQFDPVQEVDEDRVSSGFSPTTGGSVRSRGASRPSEEEVLDITA